MGEAKDYRAEYKVLSFYNVPMPLEEEMNKLALDGWEAEGSIVVTGGYREIIYSVLMVRYINE